MIDYIPDLTTTARQLLFNRPHGLKFAKIAEDTGIPAHWLSALSRGISRNPQVSRMEVLCLYLQGIKNANR